MIVVFMNMIIAIMGNTFGNVMAAQQENSLNEELALIYDHIWLLDLNNEFKDVKYIIRAVPDSMAANEDDTDISAKVDELEQTLTLK